MVGGWDDFDDIPEEDKKLRDAAKLYALLEAQIESLKEQMVEAREAVLVHFPLEFGEYEKTADGVKVSVSRGDRHYWNADMLEKIYAGTPMPLYVKRKYSVDKDKLAAMPEAERDRLLDALTRKPGIATIKVET